MVYLARYAKPGLQTVSVDFYLSMLSKMLTSSVKGEHPQSA